MSSFTNRKAENVAPIDENLVRTIIWNELMKLGIQERAKVNCNGKQYKTRNVVNCDKNITCRERIGLAF